MGGGDRLHGSDGMVDAILILGIITEANCEEVNDERIDSSESKDRSVK